MITVFNLDWSSTQEYEKLSEDDKNEFVSQYGEFHGGYSTRDYFGDPMLALKLFKEVKLKRILSCEYTSRLQEILVKIERHASVIMTLAKEFTANFATVLLEAMGHV